MNIKYKYHIEQSTRYSFKMTRVQIVQQYSRIFKTTTKMCYHSSLIQLEILEVLNEKCHWFMKFSATYLGGNEIKYFIKQIT